MSPFWILLELRMMEVVVTTGATKRAKLQLKVKSSPTTNQHPTFYMPDTYIHTYIQKFITRTMSNKND